MQVNEHFTYFVSPEAAGFCKTKKGYHTQIVSPFFFSQQDFIAMAVISQKIMNKKFNSRSLQILENIILFWNVLIDDYAKDSGPGLASDGYIESLRLS